LTIPSVPYTRINSPLQHITNIPAHYKPQLRRSCW